MRPLGAAIVLLALSYSPAYGALNAYLTMTGQKQGKVSGDQANGQIKVTKVSTQGIISTVELTSHQISGGHRQWKPILLNVPEGAWVQKLQGAVTSGEKFDVVLKVASAGKGEGSPKNGYTIHLTNAVVTKLAKVTVQKSAAAGKPGEDRIELQLSFTKIEWTWNDGGTTFSDDWDART